MSCVCVCTWVCACGPRECVGECRRVSESVRVRVRAGLFACPRPCACVQQRPCGCVVSARGCVSVCARICVRALVRVCARMRRAHARARAHACARVRSSARATVFCRSIGKRLRACVACACARVCVCVCAPRGWVGAVVARRRPAVLIARPAAPGGRACAVAVWCDRPGYVRVGRRYHLDEPDDQRAVG